MASNTVSVRFDALGGPNMVTQVKTITSSVDGLRTSLGTLKSASLPGGQAFSGALGGFNTSIAQAEKQTTSFGSKLKSLGGSLAQNATSFGVATASIWGVYNAYDNLVKVEIRAESASNRVRTMTTTLQALEERRRIGLEKGNLTAEQVSVLDNRIADTKAKLATAQEREADLQGDVNEAWANFYTTVGPQVVAAGGSIVQMVNSLNTSFAGKGGIVNSLKSGITGLIPGFKAMKAESLLLKPALGGIGVAGATLPKLFGDMGSGMTNLAGGFGKASFAAGTFGRSMIGILGPIGLVIAGAILIIKTVETLQQKMKEAFNAAGYKPKGLEHGLLGALSDPAEQKGVQDEMKLWEEIAKKKGGGVSLFDITKILGDKGEVDQLKKGGILSQAGDQVLTVGKNAQTASAQVKSLATTGNALVDSFLGIIDNGKKVGERYTQFIDSGIDAKKVTDALVTANQIYAKSQGDVAVAMTKKEAEHKKMIEQQLIENGQFAVTAQAIKELEQSYVDVASAQMSWQKIDLENLRLVKNTTDFGNEYVANLEAQNDGLRKNAIALGAGSGGLAKFALGLSHTSGEVITSSEGLREYISQLVEMPGIMESAKDAFVNFQFSVKKTADENLVLRQGLLQSLAATHSWGELMGKTTQELQNMYIAEHDVVAAQDLQIQKTRELQAAQQKLFNGVSDLANQYQVKLNPALIGTTKQLEEVGNALEQWQTGIDELRDPSDLFELKPFKIKFDVEKEFEGFLKDLPKGLRKDITLNIKSEAANKNAGQLLGLIAKTALQDIELGVQFKVDEKGADKFVQETIDSIKDQFKLKGKDASMNTTIQGVINKLLEIKKAPDSWAKLTEYFQSAEFISAIGKLDPKGLEILQQVLGDATPSSIKNLIDQNIVNPFINAFDSSWSSALKGINAGNFFDQAAKAGNGNLGLTGILLPAGSPTGGKADTSQADAVKTAVQAAQTALTALRTDAAKPIVLAAPNAAAVGTVFKNIANVLSLYIKAVNTAKTTIPGPSPKPFAAVFQNVANVIGLYIKAVNGAKTTIPGPNPKPFATVFTNIANVLSKYIKAVNGAKTTIPAPSDKATPVINKVLSGLKSIDGFTAHATVNVGLSGPGVKFLASGFHGVVDKPTVFIAGEAGPEMVDVKKVTGPSTGVIHDKTLNVTPLPKIPTMPKETQSVVSQQNNVVSDRNITIHINSPIFLYPGGPEVGKFQKKFQLNDLSRFPMT